jgi:hypothetical protein
MRLQTCSRLATLIVLSTSRSQVFLAIAVCGRGVRCATRD